MLYLQALSPESSAYHITVALALAPGTDIAALERAFQALVDHHAALRTTFAVAESLQRVHASGSAAFSFHAAACDPGELRQQLLAESERPFDLENGPLLRLGLFERPDGSSVLLLTVHHLVCDLWSLSLLARDLGVLYSGLLRDPGEVPRLEPEKVDFITHVRREREALAGETGERLWEFWRGELGASGGVADLDLPTDRPRPAVQSHSGAMVSARLGGGLAARLRTVARAHAATPHSTLLAALQVLLFRYSGQERFLVGSPTWGRSSADLWGTVGYFVNPVPLRADLSRELPAGDALRAARETVRRALRHQGFPFPLLAERMRPVRDPSRSPLFQVLFSWQKPPAFAAQLAALALGLGGGRLRLGELEAEGIELGVRSAQFDLSWLAAEPDGELAIAVQYSDALFDRATVERMLGHLGALLAGMVGSPERAIGELPLLSAAERRQLLEEWG
ncbi:MAG: non-ribosomal peptide synthetase, partial [Acidobacteria bacterium]